MPDTVLAVLVTGLCSVVATIITQVCGNASQRRVFEYQINDLKARVTKHNNVIERMYKLETKVDIMDERVDKLENQT